MIFPSFGVLALLAVGGPVGAPAAAEDDAAPSAQLDRSPRLMHLAAEQGDPFAQYSVGYFYYHGIGVPKDFAQAFRWFRKAAEQGNAEAQNDLGSMYEFGHGVSKDFVEQFDRALANVVEVVRTAGGRAEHVGRFTIYVTDKREYLARAREVGAAYRKHMGRHFPATALVEVSSLVEADAVVEIEATAVLTLEQP